MFFLVKYFLFVCLSHRFLKIYHCYWLITYCVSCLFICFVFIVYIFAGAHMPWGKIWAQLGWGSSLLLPFRSLRLRSWSLVASAFTHWPISLAFFPQDQASQCSQVWPWTYDPSKVTSACSHARSPSNSFILRVWIKYGSKFGCWLLTRSSLRRSLLWDWPTNPATVMY